MANGTIRVRMLTEVAGRPAYHIGDVVDLRADIAQAWLKEDYCVVVRDEPVETASGRK